MILLVNRGHPRGSIDVDWVAQLIDTVTFQNEWTWNNVWPWSYKSYVMDDFMGRCRTEITRMVLRVT